MLFCCLLGFFNQEYHHIQECLMDPDLDFAKVAAVNMQQSRLDILCDIIIVNLSVHLSVRLFVGLSVYTSVHPSVRPSGRPSIHPSIHLSVCLCMSIQVVYMHYIYQYLTRFNTGLENSTRPLVFTSASGCWASRILSFLSEKFLFPIYANIF